MISDHNFRFKGLTFPKLSDNTYEVEVGVSVETISTKTRQVSYVLDWIQYWDGDLFENTMVWKSGDVDMLYDFNIRYRNRIRDLLLAFQIEMEYNEAEDNGYPNW